MKKRMYKIMALAMTAAMVVPMAAQTTVFAADDKEITYWNIAVESPDKDIVTAAVDKFNKETESGYTVNQVSIQNDTYKEKLVIAMSSGECPDMHASWSGGPMYEYIDSGSAQPIDDLLDKSDVKDKLLDAAIEQGSYNGHVYAIPYLNVSLAGIFYNKDMFAEHGWEIPQTWDEFISLCDEIQNEGIQPLYFGYKDTWTCLAPWNALTVGLTPSDVCQQVNKGETTFSKEYPQVAEKMLELLNYGEDGPFGYGYNDACTAFANGESAMYTIGSYAIPQIKSVNPDMNIGSFVMPANDSEEDNVLNSGVDLQFCVMDACENKEAAYEVLDFLMNHDSIQSYLDAQNAVPCKDEDFALAPELEDMKPYIQDNRMADYQDHYYPSEMAVDAQIQTFLINQDVDVFLKKFDKDWIRYNRDIIRMMEDYEADK